jgi:Ca2+-binding RTX toxin-like protein
VSAGRWWGEPIPTEVRWRFCNPARTWIINNLITIKNYTPGQNGITRRELSTIPTNAPTTVRTIVGDFQPLDTDLVEAGLQVGYDDLGNVIQDPQSPGDRSDLLNGSANNDTLNGGAMADRLTALGGSDILTGEAMAMSWSGRSRSPIANDSLAAILVEIEDFGEGLVYPNHERRWKCTHEALNQLRLSIARSWSMSRSESCRRRPLAATRKRNGSASSTSLVANGMINVEGWLASSKAWAWTIKTGRVFSGSVPRMGFRFASQTSPRLGIGVSLEGRELAIDAQAFFSHFLRGLG